MRKPSELKVRCYAAHLIGLNEYFSDFPGSKSRDNIGKTEMNEIFLKIVPNVVRKGGCVGFIVKLLLLKISSYV